MIGAFLSFFRSKVCVCVVEYMYMYIGQYCDGINQCVVCLLLMSSMGVGRCRHRLIGVCSKLVNQLSSMICW